MLKRMAVVILLAASLSSCASVDPRKVDVELKEEPPAPKITSFAAALSGLGNMTEKYNTPDLYIMITGLNDKTGTSVGTQGEIPFEITEMAKSAINAMGGKVHYVPYDPGFIQNNVITGYTDFKNKVKPNVILTGGITEFDRSIEVRGENTDVDASAGKYKGKDIVAVKYGDDAKEAFSSITVDFNLLDFDTMLGVPKVQAVNTMKVHKVANEKELGVTILGVSFGLKGAIKKIQGRHAAVRLLVELSVIQVIGRYLNIPYWELLPDAEPDPIVTAALGNNPPGSIVRKQNPVAVTVAAVAPPADQGASVKKQENPSEPNKAEQSSQKSAPSESKKAGKSAEKPKTAITEKKAQKNAPAAPQAEPKQLASVQDPGHQPRKDAVRDSPLTIKAWTDKEAYREGEKINISFKSNKPCVVRIIYKDTEGNLIQIFPNPYNRDNTIDANTEYKIPTGDDAYSLEIVPPFGDEKIFVYASTVGLGDIPLNATGGVYEVKSKQEAVSKATRSITVKPNNKGECSMVGGKRSIRISTVPTKSGNCSEFAEYAEYELAIRTVK
jgi:hypothetical protein